LAIHLPENEKRGSALAPPLFVSALKLPAIILTSTTAAAAAAERRTLGLRTSFIHVQRPAVEFPAIQLSDRAIRLRVPGHFDESKAFGAARVAIGNDAYAFHCAVRFEHGSNGIFGRPKAEVSYENILHFFLLIT
jgi:hypothetical protein